jgi:histone H3/H4
MLVKASKVKESLKAKGMRCSAGAIAVLSAEMELMLVEAAKKATEAKRKTVQAEDCRVVSEEPLPDGVTEV